MEKLNWRKAINFVGAGYYLFELIKYHYDLNIVYDIERRATDDSTLQRIVAYNIKGEELKQEGVLTMKTTTAVMKGEVPDGSTNETRCA